MGPKGSKFYEFDSEAPMENNFGKCMVHVMTNDVCSRLLARRHIVADEKQGESTKPPVGDASANGNPAALLTSA